MRLAYIDFQNIKLGIRELGREIDRKRFFVYLKMKYKIDQVKIYIGYLSSNKDFYDELLCYGYMLVFKKTIEIDGKVKGNVDTCMAIDIAKDVYIGNLSYGILISGDGDFDVVLELRCLYNISYTVCIPNHHKIPQLFLVYHQTTNPLVMMNELYDKIAQKKDQTNGS